LSDARQGRGDRRVNVCLPGSSADFGHQIESPQDREAMAQPERQSGPTQGAGKARNFDGRDFDTGSRLKQRLSHEFFLSGSGQEVWTIRS